MRRTRRQPPPDLTSLFDVLFIVIFAALIRAAAAEKPKPEPPRPKATPLDPGSLHARALADVTEDLQQRPAVVVRVSGKGSITSIEADGKTLPVDAPLLEHSPDPDVAVAYLGDRSAELRICRIAAVHLGVPDLAAYLVIIAPDQYLDDLPHALYDGLHHDLDRCLTDQKGIAVIVDPTRTP